MKMWLMLILATILITFASTYVWMYQGAQALADVGREDEFTTPSQAQFTGGTLEGNALALNGGDSRPGAESIVSLPIKCTGSAPLKVELLRVSCACAHTLLFNDRKLELYDTVMLQPGEAATLQIKWTPKDDQANNPSYRFSAIFLLNDPQFSPTFRVEVTTRILSREGKS